MGGLVGEAAVGVGDVEGDGVGAGCGVGVLGVTPDPRGRSPKVQA